MALSVVVLLVVPCSAGVGQAEEVSSSRPGPQEQVRLRRHGVLGVSAGRALREACVSPRRPSAEGSLGSLPDCPKLNLLLRLPHFLLGCNSGPGVLDLLVFLRIIMAARVLDSS